ncbi:MAG: protein kinase, partial [Acidobacteriota bacterium]
MSSDTSSNDHGTIGVYRLLTRLGKGGMGEVFRAYDERLEREVAIKRIRAERSFDASARSRFRREAQAVARLSHPSIVSIFDVI